MTDKTAPESTTTNVVMIPTAPTRVPAFDIDQTWRLAKAYAYSPTLPPSYYGNKNRKYTEIETAGAVFQAVSYGHEIGLSPAQSIQCIAVIHGRTMIYGDALLAVLWANSLWVGKGFKESWDEKNKTYSSTMERVGGIKHVVKYSYAKAERLGLPAKNPLYRQDPETMLMWRARHQCARELFPDVLRGLTVVEVARDEALVDVEGEIIDVGSPPPAAIETSPSEPEIELEDDLAPVELDEQPLEEVLPELPIEEPEPEGPEAEALEWVVELGENPDGTSTWNAWYKAMSEAIENVGGETELEQAWVNNKENLGKFEARHAKFYARLLESFKARKKALKA